MGLLIQPELVPAVSEPLRVADVAIVDGQAVGAVDGVVGDHRQRGIVAAGVGDPVLQDVDAESGQSISAKQLHPVAAVRTTASTSARWRDRTNTLWRAKRHVHTCCDNRWVVHASDTRPAPRL